MKKKSRNSYLLRRFGITEEQYDDLYRKQDGCCAVCKRPSVSFRVSLAVDHDHHTGEIRGLLCNYCNRRVVGRYRKGNGYSLLLAAYNYLISEYSGWYVPARRKVKKRKRK